MTIEQVSEEEFPYHLLFKPPVSAPQETDELNLIEKCLKQLAAKELSGGPYVKDYLHDQKRRNCRPMINVNYFFLSTTIIFPVASSVMLPGNAS